MHCNRRLHTAIVTLQAAGGRFPTKKCTGGNERVLMGMDLAATGAQLPPQPLTASQWAARKNAPPFSSSWTRCGRGRAPSLDRQRRNRGLDAALHALALRSAVPRIRGHDSSLNILVIYIVSSVLFCYSFIDAAAIRLNSRQQFTAPPACPCPLCRAGAREPGV